MRLQLLSSLLLCRAELRHRDEDTHSRLYSEATPEVGFEPRLWGLQYTFFESQPRLPKETEAIEREMLCFAFCPWRARKADGVIPSESGSLRTRGHSGLNPSPGPEMRCPNSSRQAGSKKGQVSLLSTLLVCSGSLTDRTALTHSRDGHLLLTAFTDPKGSSIPEPGHTQK